MTKQPWFTVRCLFHDQDNNTYEERTVLVRAASSDEAIKIAEDDAKDYAKTVGSEYLGYADSFHIFDEAVGHLTEIFSLMRTSNIDSETYIDTYLDSGIERRKS